LTEKAKSDTKVKTNNMYSVAAINQAAFRQHSDLFEQYTVLTLAQPAREIQN